MAIDELPTEPPRDAQQHESRDTGRETRRRWRMDRRFAHAQHQARRVREPRQQHEHHVARDEFRRRARIGAGGFQSLARLWPLALPKAGWTAFAFVSHKILRWLAPIFLLLVLAANLLLAGHPLYRLLLIGQAAFYSAAAIGVAVPGNGKISRLLRLAALFTSMNAALAVGLFRWLAGTQRGTWQRTTR